MGRNYALDKEEREPKNQNSKKKPFLSEEAGEMFVPPLFRHTAKESQWPGEDTSTFSHI